MSVRAAELVSALGLVPHPEGGAYREVFRSERAVQPRDTRGERSALTVIYFLLSEGEQSAWHRVASDEAWIWLEGDALQLYEAEVPGGEARTTQLGAVGREGVPVHVVPAGVWQAARSAGAYSLVACVVGPGFDFADFDLDVGIPLPER